MMWATQKDIIKGSYYDLWGLISKTDGTATSALNAAPQAVQHTNAFGELRKRCVSD